MAEGKGDISYAKLNNNVSLGVGHRLFDLLLHSCQRLYLDLALAEGAHTHQASETASKLLGEIQALERETNDIIELIEHQPGSLPTFHHQW